MKISEMIVDFVSNIHLNIPDLLLAEYKRGKGVPRRGQHKKDETKQIGIELECGVPLINPSHGLQLRIIGGREAAPGKWPWQVAILNRFKVGWRLRSE